MHACAGCGADLPDRLAACPRCGAIPAPAFSDDGAAATAELMPPGASSSLVGMTIDGQFEVDAVIGGGAFATVYRAKQLGIDRAVAIKVPTHEISIEPVLAKRFAREAKAAARIRHPGVVTIYAVGELEDRRPYLAMELVDGAPLDRILRDGPLPAPRALAIVRQIASALSDTHAAGVVHRDLKPSNIIWQRDRNGDDRIVIVDFGIAVAKHGNADATRLTDGGLLGTPHYMSPELAHGDAVDGRADIYSLGCVLFELVTGMVVFDGGAYEVMLAHLGRPAPRARDLRPSVPPAVDALIADMLAKPPDDRPATADAVVARIDAITASARTTDETADTAIAASTAPPPPPSPSPPPRSAAPRSRLLPRALFVVLALAVVAGGAALAVEHFATDASDVALAPGPGDRALVQDDGDTTMRIWFPESIHAGVAFVVRLQIWNKLGQPLTDSVVVTVEDPRGLSRGFSAKPRADKHFEFTRKLPQVGRYTLHIYPPNTDSTFDIPIDVDGPPPR